MTFYGIREQLPGPRWKGLFDALWPGHRSWYLREGGQARPSLALAERQRLRHMPELVATWRRLVELGGGDETRPDAHPGVPATIPARLLAGGIDW